MSEFNEEKFRKDAQEAFEGRRKGTHVHHPVLGIITVQAAKAKCGSTGKDGREITPDQFRGDPDTGTVNWARA